MFVVASLTDPIVQFAVDVIDAMGLPGIFLLMVAESACIPIPSEATFLFAGFNVSEGEYSLAALVNTARELRARRGEMIVAGSPADVAARLGAWEVAHRPALAANVDQAVMILKMLRPKTAVKRPVQRAKQRITSLTLPRVEPPGRTA